MTIIIDFVPLLVCKLIFQNYIIQCYFWKREDITNIGHSRNIWSSSTWSFQKKILTDLYFQIMILESNLEIINSTNEIVFSIRRITACSCTFPLHLLVLDTSVQSHTLTEEPFAYLHVTKNNVANTSWVREVFAKASYFRHLLTFPLALLVYSTFNNTY